MKNLFLLATILYSLQGNAQNYQCLEGGAKRYYTNRNGYLRGMRIDSIRTSGADIIYYPFHTARGKYIDIWTTPLDSNGGSWLGKKVIQQNDGTFLFDNIWNDTIIVKTGAHTGDTWTFYNDTTPKYYTATVMAEDTMTVLGSPDSIKTIRINAYNSSGLDPTDSINNFEITLSKNSGFVKVFDIYTFPYHRPDTNFYIGVDYYLDCLLDRWICNGSFASSPGASNSIFSLVSLINPTYTQLYDWNIGDAFEYSEFTPNIISDGFQPHDYHFDSITARTAIPGGIQYSYSGWKAEAHIHPLAILTGAFTPSTAFSYDTFSISGTLTVPDMLLIDTMKMPEQRANPYLLYYLPKDTGFCLHSAKYMLYNSNILNYSFSYLTEGCDSERTYKTGLGLTNYHWDILGGSPPKILDTTLLYYVKGGVPCGHFTYPSPINYIAGIIDVNKISFAVFPNPATEELTIKTNSTKSYTITLQNMLGQVIITQQTTKQQQTINVASIPAGIYSVSITDEQGYRHTEKVLVTH